MRGGILDQPFAMAQVRAQPSDLRAWTEAAPEQAVLMELLQPLRIVHVALAAGHMLDVARVHEDDRDAPRLEDLKRRNPVHPGRFHRDRRDADPLEPVGQSMEVTAERAERPHRLLVTIRRHRHDMKGGADIEAGSMGVDRGPLS
jgi:hypothetical protein